MAGGCATAVVLGCLAMPVAAADEVTDVFWQFRMVTGLEYSDGDYGAARDTELTYIPFTLEGKRGPWTVRGTVPWIYKSGPAVISDGSAEAGSSTGAGSSGRGCRPG